MAITAMALVAGATASAADPSSGIAPASAAEVAAFETSLDNSAIPAKDVAAYESLTPEQQAQFVTAVLSDDPASLPGVEVVSTATTSRVPAATTSGLASRSATAGAAAAVVYDVTSTSRFDSSLFGITLGYWKQVFRYQTGSGVVLSVQSCVGTWTGFSGFWSVSKSDAQYVSSGQGYCITTFTGSLIYEGSNVSMNKEMVLVVNGPGIVSRSIRNL